MAKQQKSLQNLTVSDEPTSYAELVAHIEEQYPPLPANASLTQQRARSEAIVKALLASSLPSEEVKADLRNQTWQMNHDELTRAIGKLTNEAGRMPTINHLSEETGLSRQTIYKHLKEFHQSDRYQDQLNQFRILSDRVLATLYRLATVDGDVRAAKVFLDVVGGVPIQGSRSSENTNYIQVNNNIKIDQVTFATLPESVQKQITGLILEGLQQTAQTSTPPQP